MNGFKHAKTLYDEQREKGKLGIWETPSGPGQQRTRRTPDLTSSICEFFTLEGCEASLEAVKLGLAKTVFPCQGSIPPYCAIQKKLIAGMTIKELYEGVQSV